MRVTSKGQVTIPQATREALGFWPGTEVEFVREGDRVILRRAATGDSRGARLVEHLRGRTRVTMSTDQLMQLTRGD